MVVLVAAGNFCILEDEFGAFAVMVEDDDYDRGGR